MTRSRILRTYLADCASLAIALTDQIDLQRAPAFAVQVLCAGETGHTQPVRQFLQGKAEGFSFPVTGNDQQRKLDALDLCIACLCTDDDLPEQVRLSHQRVTTFLNTL